ARMHVFPYSEREGTKAAAMEGSVPRHVREERARRLIAVGRELERAALERRVGKTDDVLIEETDEQGRGMGYTGGYMRVHVKGAQPGAIVRVRIDGVEKDGLTGAIE
ncbi:MAG: TRAM domain-containing protein, partial [Candidatus Ventricola sp.]